MEKLDNLLRAMVEYSDAVGQTPINHMGNDCEEAEALREELSEVSVPANAEGIVEVFGSAMAHFMGLELYARNSSGEDTTDLIATKFKEAVIVGMIMGSEMGFQQAWDGLDVGECSLELISEEE